MGRLLDLKSAYKQFFIAPSSQWAAGISVFNPTTGKQELYVAEVLPFGAVGSVYAFCRFSRALKRIGTALLDLVWTNYVDDFTQVDISASGDGAQAAAEDLVELLGWKVATKKEKRKPFAKVFDSLGVVFDFTLSTKGEFAVTNKPSRLEALEATADRWESTGRCTQAEAMSLRGVVNFAENQLFARASAILMPALRQKANPSTTSLVASAGLVKELRDFVKFLKRARPRRIVASDRREPLCLLVDADLNPEAGTAGLGGVLLDENGVAKELFLRGSAR